jgi:site-specific recombinase XerD
LLYIIFCVFFYCGGDVAAALKIINMQEKCRTFEELISAASDYLKTKLVRTEQTVKLHVHVWRRVKRYMDFQKIENFSPSVGQEYIQKKIREQRPFKELSRVDQNAIHFVNVLCEFSETGIIKPRKKPLYFDGAVGQLMTEYLSEKMMQRLKEHTLYCHKQCLHNFLTFLEKTGVTTIRVLSHIHLINYIKGIDASRVGLSRMLIQNLKGFLKYLHEKHHTDADLSQLVPRFNRRNTPQLPSTYLESEVDKLIGSIDRGTNHGKRDYAMILLAARIGLRASDIANLKFENINWEKCNIQICQFKTGRSLELPLLPEIGDALIDYLKYGRPISNEPYFFLLSKKPFSRLYGYCVSMRIQSYFLKAGIQTENKKHGSHALRHSLAAKMLEKGTTVPVISEVLGHEYTSSTEYYLRVDLKSMRQCALDVQPVSQSFYNQKGGLFYAY